MLKYIIFEANGLVHPVLFGNHTSHKQINVTGGKPVAAGFVKFDSFGWPHCYGESESLGISSRGQLDEDIIRRAERCDATAMFMVEFNQPENDEEEKNG